MKVIFTLIGTLIGAGFASGQEVYVFFYSYGIKGLIGLTLSSIIIGLVIYKTLEIIKKENIKSYDQLLDYILKNKKVKSVMNITINIFILVSFYVMIAGFGAYFEQEFNINSIFGSMLLGVVCFIVFKSNIKRFVKINEILIPILVIVILVMRSSKCKKYEKL